MNLEGDGNGICDPNAPNYIGHSCDENGGDFLEIYDGRDATAPLLARLNGQPTDVVLKQVRACTLWERALAGREQRHTSH